VRTKECLQWWTARAASGGVGGMQLEEVKVKVRVRVRVFVCAIVCACVAHEGGGGGGGAVHTNEKGTQLSGATPAVNRVPIPPF
jgi:hypothetical protein